MEEEVETPRRKPRDFPVRGILAIAVIIALIVWLTGDDALETSDLHLMPETATFLFVADVDAINDTTLAASVRRKFKRQIDEIESEFRERIGFDTEALSSVAFGGSPNGRDFAVIFGFKEDPSDELLARLVKSLRTKSDEPTEIHGYRVWGSENDRTRMIELRTRTLLVGEGKSVAHALDVLDKGGTNPLVETLTSHGALDASFAGVFDLTAAGNLSRGLSRDLRDIVPAMAKHMGPILVHANVDAGVEAEWRMLSAEDPSDTAMRSRMEIDGDFLERVLLEVARLVANER